METKTVGKKFSLDLLLLHTSEKQKLLFQKSFQKHLYGEQSQKVDLVCPSEAESRFAYCPVYSNILSQGGRGQARRLTTTEIGISKFHAHSASTWAKLHITFAGPGARETDGKMKPPPLACLE